MSEQNRALSAANLYIELLKQTLTYSLWPEPPQAVTLVDRTVSRPKRMLLYGLNALFATKGFLLAKKPPPLEQLRSEGKGWPAYAHTMIGMKRLENLQYCIETVLHDKVPGDFIETGVWRGGACIFMRGVMAALGVTDRKVFVADSFQGLPEPDPAFPIDAKSVFHRYEYLAVSKAQVEENFRKYNLLDEQVVFLEGWFDKTLPTAPIDRLAIARLDGDIYSSTIAALENLYPKLSSGGFCIIDDYNLEGARGAVTDYRQQHGFTEPLIPIDFASAYWRKA